MESHLNQKVISLTKVVYHLANANDEHQKEIKTVQDRYEKEIAQILQDAYQKIDAFRTKVDELQKQIDSAESSDTANAKKIILTKFREHKIQTAKKHQNLLTKIESLTEIVNESQEDFDIRLETFTMKSKKLRDEIRRKETELDTARVNLESFVREANTKYNLAHTEHLNEKDDLHNTIHRLKKMNEDTRVDLAKERKALEAQKKRFDEEMRKSQGRSKQDEMERILLKTKNESLLEQVKELEKKIVGLQEEQGAQYRRISAELENCRRENTERAVKAQIALTAAQQEAKRNFNQLRQTEASLADLKEQSEKFETAQALKITKIAKEHDDKISCLQQIHQDTLQTTNEDNRKALDWEVALRKKRVADLNLQLDELRAELATKSSDLSDSKKMIKDLEKDLSDTFKKLEASMGLVEELRQTSATVGSAQLETRAALERQRIRADKAEQLTKELKKSTDEKIASLSNDLKEANTMIKELDLRSAGQNKEIQELTKACKDQLDDVNSKHTEMVNNLKNSHERSLHELSQNMDSQRKIHQKEIEALLVSHKTALSEIEAEHKRDLQKSQGSANELTIRIQDLERNLRMEKDSLSKITQDKEKLFKDLDASKLNFEKMSRARKKLQMEIKSTTEEWSKKCKALSLKLSESSGAYNQLGEQNKKLMKENDVLDKNIEQSEENYKKMDESYKKMKLNNAEITETLKIAVASKLWLETQLDETMSKLEKLSRENENLDSELSESNAKFTDLRTVTNQNEDRMNKQIELQFAKIGQLQTSKFELEKKRKNGQIRLETQLRSERKHSMQKLEVLEQQLDEERKNSLAKNTNLQKEHEETLKNLILKYKTEHDKIAREHSEEIDSEQKNHQMEIEAMDEKRDNEITQLKEKHEEVQVHQKVTHRKDKIFLEKSHAREVQQLKDENTSRLTKLTATLKEELNKYKILYKKYTNRPSRKEDVHRITQLETHIKGQDLAVFKAKEEKLKLKLELVNRETNFNKVFGREPNVGTMIPAHLIEKTPPLAPSGSRRHTPPQYGRRNSGDKKLPPLSHRSRSNSPRSFGKRLSGRPSAT